MEEKLEYLVSEELVEYRRIAWLTVVAMETLKTRHHCKKINKINQNIQFKITYCIKTCGFLHKFT